MLKGPDTEINLHVFSAGVSEVEKMLRLRDWLRASPQDREKYAEVKRGLAALLAPCPALRRCQKHGDQ